MSVGPRAPAPRRGTTLIEVVCAMTIAATLLVAVLVATGRQGRQARAAAERREACSVLDALLTAREAGTASLALGGAAAVPGRDGWAYEVTRTPAGEVAGVRLTVERVEVFRSAGPAAGREDAPSAAVEMLVPAGGPS